MYICLSGCGTLVKAKKGETLPICYYCLDRVHWRYLEPSGIVLRSDLMPDEPAAKAQGG